ncbi:PepSY domain-containing protein [Nitrososphaera viennensis]|nr:hypothetical protein [Nitrososphaera viennensis]UVS68153.1 hypothetical protein NWT39_09605 [Nitrososphaera viennensis]
MEGIGNSNSRKTQMIVMAGVMAAVLATAAVFMTQPALAQQGTNSTQSGSNNSDGQQQAVPQLNGSVNVRDAAKAFLRDNAKVPFSSALDTAQEAVSNGTVIGGQLTVVQGYLVYAFKVADFDAGTSKIVIVDAGNGSVLYTSADMPLHFGGFGGGYGCARGHSFGHHYGMNWGDRVPSSSSSSNSGSGSSLTESMNA